MKSFKIIEKTILDLNCPNIEHKFPSNLKELKDLYTHTCPQCGSTFIFQFFEGEDTIRAFEEALAQDGRSREVQFNEIREAFWDSDHPSEIIKKEIDDLTKTRLNDSTR
jgi:hypothetical protein